MIEKIDLSNFSFAFEDAEITNLRKKNYIYGKNGTGKSSLVNAIKNQYSEEYDIKVFDGWEGIIKDNNYLDAIALGEINTTKQNEIDKIDEQIKEINGIIEEPLNNAVNLFVKKRDTEKNYDRQNSKLEKYYTDSARSITELLNLGRRYNKSNFKVDIDNANLLSESEIERLQETISAKKIELSNRITFPDINLESYLRATNEILQTVVLPSSAIVGLNEDIEKQNFAKEGMRMHNRHDSNEICAFCGNNISQTRWKDLDGYFSDEVEKLDKRIVEGISNLESYLTKVEKIPKIDEVQFYPDFRERLMEINIDMFELKRQYIEALKEIKEVLDEKKSKTYLKIEEVKMDIPKSFTDIKTKYDKLYTENREYSKNLQQKQEKAKDKIRLHEVNKALDEFDYNKEISNLQKYETELSMIKNDISELVGQKKDLLILKDQLISETTNVSTTALKINNYLRSLGTQTFSLKHIESPDGKKGQYQILDNKGRERRLHSLSDGEKNIVAFLWFMDSIDGVNEVGVEQKEKVVILDDPMTSNDDNYQYLMIGVIQQFLKDETSPQFFLLTHNNHFYLQVTPQKKKYNSSQSYIKILKTDSKSKIFRIMRKDDNLKTIYDELWEELKFAYDNNKVIFMWNNMRRILETFNQFNFKKDSIKDITQIFEDSQDEALALALIKSLHINSHVGYLTDIDISGQTRESLKTLFCSIFEKIGAKIHFESYWPTTEEE